MRCKQQFDSLSSTMLFVVALISSVVYIYSMDYLGTDPHQQRFFCYLMIFTFLMLVFITSDNLLQAFVGWEGVGLASFLLINYWSTRAQAVRSAIKALVFNRFGDFGLMLAICCLYSLFGSLDFATMQMLAPYITDVSIPLVGWEVSGINLAGTLLVFAASAKSAQLGLHAWLALLFTSWQRPMTIKWFTL